MLQHILEKYDRLDETHSLQLWGFFSVGIYVLAFAIAIVISYLFPGILFVKETTSSYIGTSIQIQATILAIVISLTILAVEMSASKYSPRVTEIFKKNISMYIFLFSYILSIIIGSIFLVFINNFNSITLLTIGTLFYLALGNLLVVLLIPYFLTILNFLDTENIIKKLSQNVDIHSIEPSKDPFQSVFDVIYGAIKINDFTTMSTGLISAEKRLKEIFDGRVSGSEEDYIFFRFFDDMKRCGFLLVEKKENKYAFEIINRLITINEWAIDKQDIILLKHSIATIQEIGVRACEYKMKDVVNHSLTALSEISNSIVKEDLTQRSDYVKKYGGIIYLFIDSLVSIGFCLIKQDTKITRSVFQKVNDFTKEAIKLNININYNRIIEKNISIMKSSIELGESSIFQYQLYGFYHLASLFMENSMIENANMVLKKLYDIAKFAADHNSYQIVHQVGIKTLDITLEAIDKEIKEVEEKGVRHLIFYQSVGIDIFQNRESIGIENIKFQDGIKMSKNEFDIEKDQLYISFDSYFRHLDEELSDSVYDNSDYYDSRIVLP